MGQGRRNEQDALARKSLPTEVIMRRHGEVTVYRVCACAWAAVVVLETSCGQTDGARTRFLMAQLLPALGLSRAFMARPDSDL